MRSSSEIHQGMPVVYAGRPLDEADRAVILLHGRGATAQSILSLTDHFERFDFAYVAPQARGNTWYPYRFIAPLDQNEPYLSSALQVIDDLVADLGAKGISQERIVLGGFSQGACLAAEYVARRARRYGGLFVFSGGLIGPEGIVWNYEGSLDGTPIFIGCSDRDAHIPLFRVKESTKALEALGGDVIEKIYPGMGHTVNQDEIDHAVSILDSIA